MTEPNENNENNENLTVADKEILLRDHLLEAERLAGEISTTNGEPAAAEMTGEQAAASLGVDLSGETPAMQSVADHPAVKQALQSLGAAEAEVGVFAVISAIVGQIRKPLGL